MPDQNEGPPLGYDLPERRIEPYTIYDPNRRRFLTITGEYALDGGGCLLFAEDTPVRE